MVKSRLAVIYNICGISGKDNLNYYFKALDSILANLGPEDAVYISGCMTKLEHQDALLARYGHLPQFGYIWTEEVLPVNVTFNRSVRDISSIHDYQAYVFVDSGCIFNSTHVLEDLWTTYKNSDATMVSVLTDEDSGVKAWFGVEDTDLSVDNMFKVPVGKALNLHVQLFSKDILEAYGNIIPDIFASYCTESVFTFLCAAIRSSWVVRTDIMVNHAWSLDGASSGFNPHGIIAQVMPPWQHTFRSTRTMQEIIDDPRGTTSGFGYEEVQGIKVHDPSKFDENGYCLDPDLQWFIKDNLFLANEALDYDKIKGESSVS